MSALKIVAWSIATPARLTSSGLHPTSTISNLESRAQAVFMSVVPAATTRLGSDRSGTARLVSSRSRRTRWVSVRDVLAVEALPRSSAGAAAPAPVDTEPERPVAAEPTPVMAPPEGLAEAAPAAKPSMKGELTIDSLRTYELVKPIPVLVEMLGERHYVAEVPELGITTSASSFSEILMVIKDRVAKTYNDLCARKHLDPDQERQLKTLEMYIGKSKRGWLDRR